MRHFMLLAVFLAFCSCNNEGRIEKEIKALSGRELLFPEGYVSLSYHDSLKVEPLVNADIKIVSYYDNIVCSSCSLNKLKAWVSQADSIDPEIPYLIVIHSNKKEEFVETARQIKLPYPLMFYDSDVFKVENKLDVLDQNRTFLLDKNNKIVLVGEPFSLPRLADLYKKQIQKMKVEYSKK